MVRIGVVLGIVLGIGLGGAALFLALDARNRADKAREAPTLEIGRGQLGPFLNNLRIQPGVLKDTGVGCPTGYTVIGGGFETVGPVLPTAARPISEFYFGIEGYNESTSGERGRMGGTVICVRGRDGLRIKRVELEPTQVTPLP